MRRRVAAVSLALVLGVTGAACGGGGSSAVEIVRASSEKTVAADSAKVSVVVDAAVEGVNSTFTGDGAFDFVGKKGVLTLDLGSVLPGAKLETRLLGDIAYVGVPPNLAGLLGGKKFLRLDIKALAAQNEQFGGLSGGTDPTSGVDALRGAKDVTEVGKEDIRGESTTHYKGTLDLAAAKAELEGEAAESVDELTTLLKTEDVPFEVWIDGAGRVRRTSMSVDLAASEKTDNKAVSTSIVTELYDFGVDVDVVEPPAADVADGNAFLQGISGGAGG